MSYCSHCGTVFSADIRFCQHCGAATQPSPGPGNQQPVAAQGQAEPLAPPAPKRRRQWLWALGLLLPLLAILVWFWATYNPSNLKQVETLLQQNSHSFYFEEGENGPYFVAINGQSYQLQPHVKDGQLSLDTTTLVYAQYQSFSGPRHLYWGNPAENHYTQLSGTLQQFYFSRYGKQLYYTEQDDTLFYYNGSTKTQLAEQVDGFVVSFEGNYVAYRSGQSLYLSRRGQTPQKLETNIDSGAQLLFLANNGDTLLYAVPAGEDGVQTFHCLNGLLQGKPSAATAEVATGAGPAEITANYAADEFIIAGDTAHLYKPGSGFKPLLQQKAGYSAQRTPLEYTAAPNSTFTLWRYPLLSFETFYMQTPAAGGAYNLYQFHNGNSHLLLEHIKAHTIAENGAYLAYINEQNTLFEATVEPGRLQHHTEISGGVVWAAYPEKAKQPVLYYHVAQNPSSPQGGGTYYRYRSSNSETVGQGLYLGGSTFCTNQNLVYFTENHPEQFSGTMMLANQTTGSQLSIQHVLPWFQQTSPYSFYYYVLNPGSTGAASLYWHNGEEVVLLSATAYVHLFNE